MDKKTSNSYRPLGATGLNCHPIGFGCYRVLDTNSEHEASLRHYLSRGGNLIDTSANYGDGRAERLLGKVLPEIPREQFILVTKGGYIQGRNLSLAQQRQFPEIVHYGEGLWHCIHPEFLETQIQASLESTGMKFIDVYLLHNPEYFLEDHAQRNSLTEAVQDEYYQRIQAAFQFLENKVSEGIIHWYGISSNNFVEPTSSLGLTRLVRCWEAAQAVSPNHHFRVVQMPLNLLESGGAFEQNCGSKTVIEYAREKGIGVLVNRPLNAFASDRMIRLADFLPPGTRPPGPEDLHAILAPVRAMENELEEKLQIPLMYGAGKGIAAYLENVIPQVKSPVYWEQIFYEHVIAPIERWAVQCQQMYSGNTGWANWWQNFMHGIPPILGQLEGYVYAAQQGASDEVRQQLHLAGYPDNGQSLSRIAQHVLLQLPGVSCVLTGMRHRNYVDDSLGASALPAVDSLVILERFQRTASQQPVGSVQ